MMTHKLSAPAMACSLFLITATVLCGQGQRMFHLGNSHTASTLQKGFDQMATAEGYPDHEWDGHNIPGAPIDWLWNHPSNGDGARGTLDVPPGFDVMTLQSYNKTDEDEIASCINFTDLALTGNTDCRVIMFTIWPGSADDWENPAWGRDEQWPEQVKAEIEAAHPGVDVTVAPTSLIIRELGFMAEAGELPGIDTRFDFFSDGGHLNDTGAYVVCLTFFSMVYDEDPVGVTPHDWSDPTLFEPFDDVPRETAEAIQPVVRDILATYPPAGVDAGLISITRKLEPALENQPYSVQLEAINNDGALSWSLVSGSLPPGFNLSPEGLLSGTTADVGQYEFTIRVEDNADQFDRPYKMVVAEDVPPVITTDERLPDLRCDEYIFEQLTKTGGVGSHSWEFAGGQPPNGMTLAPTGILYGTPGEEGLFHFTVKVTDSHPVSPRTTEKSFFWKIGPKDPATVVVNHVPSDAISNALLDGVPDEEFWQWNEISKAVAGSPTVEARFALVYTRNEDGMMDSVWVAVEVENPDETVHEAAGIDLYADLLHNGEIIFNSDDYYLFYPRDGQGWPELRQGQRSRLGYDDYEVVETANGYTMEARLAGAKMFFGSGVTIVPQSLLVYGFDIGVRQGPNSEHRLMWQGDTANDEDTSKFGSILISQFGWEVGDLVEENIAEWSFATGSDASDQDPVATRSSAWLAEVPELVLGSGLTKTGNQHYAWDNFGISNADSGSLDPDEYVEISLAPKQGAKMSLTRLDWPFCSWGESKVVNAELRWSDDDFATHQVIPLSDANPISLDPRRSPIPVHADLSAVTELQDREEPVDFRLYLWGNQDSSLGLGRRAHIPDILLIGRMEETHGEAVFEAENATPN